MNDETLTVEADGRTITYMPIVMGLSQSIYTYVVYWEGQKTDEGYIIVGSKVKEDETLDDEDDSTIFFYLSMAESENVYITEMPYLFSSVEELLSEISIELIQATGTNEFVSQFMTNANLYSEGS